MPDVFYLYEKDQGIGPRFVGELRKLSDDGEDYEFQYGPNAVREIRMQFIRMPIRQEPYGKDLVDPLIMNWVSPQRGCKVHRMMCEQGNIPLDASRWEFLEKHLEHLKKVIPNKKMPLWIGATGLVVTDARSAFERK